MSKLFPALTNIHTIVFDFDGVFTDNKVYVREDGKETVCCNRADGLGLDIFRAICSKKKIKLDYFILSKEKNLVVDTRAKKLKVPCYAGINNKIDFIDKYFAEHRPEDDNPFSGLIYLGNDLNDLPIIKLAGFSVAPNNAHDLVKLAASIVLPQNGGDGFVRVFIEELLRANGIGSTELETLI